MRNPLRRRVRAMSRRRRVPAVVSAVVLLAVGGAGAAELTARAAVRDRVARAAPALGADVTVGTGGDWALWDLVNGSVPRLEISSRDARFAGLSGIRVRARLDDVRLGPAPSVGASRALVEVSTGSIADAIRSRAPSVPVASVTTVPADGTVVAAVGPGGAGRLTLRPVLADGRVTLNVDGFTLFGRSVPAGRFAPDGSGPGPGPGPGSGARYPLGLRATSLHVGAEGLDVTLTGGPARPGDAAAGGT
ncbi:LmeA family phospholipid-binding protein [Streptomyces sp. NPDC048507]|uniref:LmeA family phospholipid-binding protein n=1 Tax=Streptomyces sp. NPDC048507 TaxID=3365560 RepID=UPI0037105D42